MAKENCFVFMEEGGAGRAIIAKAGSRKEAEKNIHASIGGKVRFAKGATKEFREHDLWTQPFSQEQTLNGIKFEDRAALVHRFFLPQNCEVDDGIQDPPPNRFIYEGPYGKVCIAFNDRTIEWEAYCYPEGADGREVILPLVATSKKLAEREAVAVLRDEATHDEEIVPHATREEAVAAVRTLIRYTGDNPDREGLLSTPDRVVRAYDELFAGYKDNAWDVLNAKFEETGSYDEMVLLTDIEFESHCEHHMVPFIGKAHIAYFPKQKVIGISKLARLVEVYSRRLQIQEKMTTQIADNLNIVLEPKGVAVVVEAQHMCMTMRGVKKKTVKMVTSCMTGIFRKDAKMKSEFLSMIGSPRPGQA